MNVSEDEGRAQGPERPQSRGWGCGEDAVTDGWGTAFGRISWQNERNKLN